MGKSEKLVLRLKSHPVDFTFDELVTLLGHHGYTQAKSGNSSGSRVAFTDGKGDFIRLHKPHPRNVLKPYQVEMIIKALQERGLL